MVNSFPHWFNLKEILSKCKYWWFHQMIHRITFKCVQTAHEAGYSSIALPALGTGILLYPPSDCAREMLGAIRKFQKGAHLKKSVVNAGLREIVIVIYDNQGVFQVKTLERTDSTVWKITTNQLTIDKRICDDLKYITVTHSHHLNCLYKCWAAV